MKVALVCIAKNEDNYIQEWIDYNLKIGFDHIFIYANNWNYESKNRHVTVFQITGTAKQVNAYNDFKDTKSSLYNWVAFFDVDEFLVLKQHKDIKSFLFNYDDCNAIGINWALFGDNGHKWVENNEYSVLKRFTKRSLPSFNVNEHVKSIVKMPSSHLMHVHAIGTTWFNLNKEIRHGAFNSPVDWSVAQINHYFSKTKEELYFKCNRERADTGTHRKFKEHLMYLELNDEEDLLARNFMYDEYKEDI